MKILRGKKIADKILRRIKVDIREKKLRPNLAVVLVGTDKASQIYVSLKEKAAKKVGVDFQLYKFSQNSAEKKIIQRIKELNQSSEIHGIIVQLPLPKNLNTQRIINAIDPRKDVDGFSPKSASQPVFPKAILKFLERTFRRNTQAVVVSNSDKFGKIMVAALESKKIAGKYILANRIQKNIKILQDADIIISAVGRPGLIVGQMVKKGAIVIDGGISKVGKKVLGDVDLASVKKVASFVTPVPGGVGPVTIACLLENVYLAGKKQV